MKSVLYFSVGVDGMLTSNLWTEVGLSNITRGTVLDFVYKDSEGTINGGVPEAVVVQFQDLVESTDIEPFLEEHEQSVPIPMRQVE